MDKRTERKFEDLRRKTMSAMESVSCPLSDFLEALEVQRDELAERINGVRAELREKGEEP